MSNRWKPNVTVAAVIEREGRFLLVEEQTADGLRLNNPAGHLDPGESLEQACVRETLEETTFGFRPDALVGVYLTGPTLQTSDGNATDGVGITYLRFAFRGVLGAADAARPLDRGIVRTLWMSAAGNPGQSVTASQPGVVAMCRRLSGRSEFSAGTGAHVISGGLAELTPLHRVLVRTLARALPCVSFGWG